MRFTENQRGIIQMLSTLSIFIAATQVPEDLPYRPLIIFGLGILAIVGNGLQKFLQEDFEEKTSFFSEANPILDSYMQLSAEEQKKIMSLLKALEASGVETAK